MIDFRYHVVSIVAIFLALTVGLVIGAWPAVLLTAAATAAVYWRASDSRRPQLRRPTAGEAPYAGT